MRNIKINHLANFAWFMPVSLQDTICSLSSLLSGSWKWHRVPGGHTNSNKERMAHDSVKTRWNINWALQLHSVGSEYIPYVHHIGFMDYRKTLILLMSHLNCNFPRRWLAFNSFRQNSVSYNGSNCYPTDIFNNGRVSYQFNRASVASSSTIPSPTLTNRRSHSPHCRGIRLRF